MFKNYIKIAWRNVKKYPVYSIQNIFSLSVALVVAILANVYVVNELSFDKSYDKSERIFRVNTDIKISDQEIRTAKSSDVLGPLLMEFSQVESYVRMFASNAPFRIRKGEKYLKETNAAFVDSSLFTVFNIPIIEKLSADLLAEPNMVIITKSVATKYFGDHNALGQTLELDDLSHSVQKNGSYKVAAVIADFPQNSHFKFDFIFPFSNLDYGWGRNYAGSYFNTYVLLDEKADYQLINQQFQNITKAQIYPIVSKQLGISQNWQSFLESGNSLAYTLFPMVDIHLSSAREGELGQNGSMQTVYILIALAVFVLLMASVNYINLSTARAIGRMREVGVRKVLGSSRRSLIVQFLSESMVLVVISTMIAFFMAIVLLPYFNTYLSTSLVLTDLFRFPVLILVSLLSVFVGLISGAYPSFFLSNFKIITTLKGSANNVIGGNTLRKYLIVFQLSVSIVLVVGTLTVYNQLKHIQKVDLGYNKEQVLIINNIHALGDNSKTFKEELSNTTGVVSASLAGSIPVNSSKMMGNYSMDASKVEVSATPMRTWWVDERYFETMTIPILEGDGFSKITVENAKRVIVNEEAVKVLGLDNPIGKRIYAEKADYVIAGVVKNFNYESLREKIGPVLLLYTDGSNENFAVIKISALSDFSAILNEINKVWTGLHATETMEYYFLDEAFNTVYRNDQTVGNIGLSISLLAIIIACIGLLGMISYATERRKKEIGVRKVFGASRYDVLHMLSKEFVLLVVVSLFIATPIAWLIMNKWLQDFAYRIEIQWWLFALPGVLAMIIVLLTVSFQAVKAAMANPVESLRDE